MFADVPNVIIILKSFIQLLGQRMNNLLFREWNPINSSMNSYDIIIIFCELACYGLF